MSLKNPLSLMLIYFALTSSAFAQEIVRIGLVGPTSGPIAHLGQDHVNGARIAIEELNAKGVTIGGKSVKFELIAENDAVDPVLGSMVAKKLVDAKVNGVIGHLNPGPAIPASAIYNEAGIPQISTSATAPKYTRQRFNNTFRVVADDLLLGSALGKYAVTELKGKSIAIIDDRTAYGQGVADEFEKAVKAAGGSAITREFTTDKATDLIPLLTVIKSKKPDIIFFGGMDIMAGPMLNQMRQLGINAKFMGGDGVCSRDLPKLSAGAISDYQVICAEPVGGDVAQMNEFRSAFRARFNSETEVYAAYSYDATMVIADAMKRAGSVDPKIYLSELAKTDGYKGITGTISFDVQGNVKNGAVGLYTYRSDNREQVGVVGSAISTPAFLWPPPRASSMTVLPRSLLETMRAAGESRKTKTLGDLDKTIRSALDSAGYGSRSYYKIPGGYAIATQLERFVDDGRPAPGVDRWAVASKLWPFSLENYIKALFATEPGRFRVIVLIVTSTPVQLSSEGAVRKQAIDWVMGGFNVLPPEIAEVLYDGAMNCTALVYEFKKAPGGAPEAERPGQLTGDVHMSGSGLLSALRR